MAPHTRIVVEVFVPTSELAACDWDGNARLDILWKYFEAKVLELRPGAKVQSMDGANTADVKDGVERVLVTGEIEWQP